MIIETVSIGWYTLLNLAQNGTNSRLYNQSHEQNPSKSRVTASRLGPTYYTPNSSYWDETTSIIHAIASAWTTAVVEIENNAEE